MKTTYILLILTLLFVISSFGSSRIEHLPHSKQYVLDPDSTIVHMMDSMPSYPGGETAMALFIKDNIVYPEKSIEYGDHGKVFAKFVVEKDGRVSNVKIARGVTQELDEEALRVIRLMPKWNPGYKDNKPVRSEVVIPIIFRLNGEEKNKKKKL